MQLQSIESFFVSAANYVPSIFRDPDDKELNLNIVVYGTKKFIEVTGKFSDMPVAWATTLRKANEFIIPFLAEHCGCLAAYTPVGAIYSFAFTAADLGESWNDVNYFINGGVYKDLKKTQIFSVVGHILLVPANLISLASFLKAAEVSNALGSLAAYSLFADGCLLGAFIALGLDSGYKIYTGTKEAEKYKKLFEDKVKEMRKSTKEIKDLRNHVISDLKDMKGSYDLQRYKAKWLLHENRVTQGWRDGLASSSEVMLKGAVMYGVTSPFALFILGTFAFVAVGRSLYYRSISRDPDKGTLLK